MLRCAVAARSGPEPMRLANLGRVIKWVRDLDPRSSSSGSSPLGGGAIDPEVLAAQSPSKAKWETVRRSAYRQG